MSKKIFTSKSKANLKAKRDYVRKYLDSRRELFESTLTDREQLAQHHKEMMKVLKSSYAYPLKNRTINGTGYTNRTDPSLSRPPVKIIQLVELLYDIAGCSEDSREFLANLVMAGFGYGFHNDLRKLIINGLQPGLYRKLCNELYSIMEEEGIEDYGLLNQVQLLNKVGKIEEKDVSPSIEDPELMEQILQKSEKVYEDTDVYNLLDWGKL